MQREHQRTWQSMDANGPQSCQMITHGTVILCPTCNRYAFADDEQTGASASGHFQLVLSPCGHVFREAA